MADVKMLSSALFVPGIIYRHSHILTPRFLGESTPWSYTLPINICTLGRQAAWQPHALLGHRALAKTGPIIFIGTLYPNVPSASYAPLDPDFTRIR